MPTPTVTIHHFDDEPYNMASIRDNLVSRIMARQPGWIDEAIYEQPDDDWGNAYEIMINRPGAPLCIHYRIYPTSREFLESADLKTGDLAILDAYERDRDNQQKLVAIECASKAQVLGPGNVYLFSGYLTEVPESLRPLIPKECFIQKPFSQLQVTAVLLGKFGIQLS